MTAYVPITDAQTDPGAPGTSELWKQWRDNPIAMFEGSAGAPNLGFMALGQLTAGDSVRVRPPDASVTAQGGRALTVGFVQKGTVRVKYRATPIFGVMLVETYRIRAGTGVLVQSNSISAATDLSVDVAIIPGDSIVVVRATATNEVAINFSNMSISISPAEVFWPVDHFGLIEGNPDV